MFSKVKHTFKNITKNSFYHLLIESDRFFAFYISVILIQNCNSFRDSITQVFDIYFKIENKKLGIQDKLNQSDKPSSDDQSKAIFHLTI